MVAQREDYATAVALAALRIEAIRDADPWHQARRSTQAPPSGAWRTWLLLAGRGFGKTRSAVEWVREGSHGRPDAACRAGGADGR